MGAWGICIWCSMVVGGARLTVLVLGIIVVVWMLLMLLLFVADLIGVMVAVEMVVRQGP